MVSQTLTEGEIICWSHGLPIDIQAKLKDSIILFHNVNER